MGADLRNEPRARRGYDKSRLLPASRAIRSHLAWRAAADDENIVSVEAPRRESTVELCRYARKIWLT